MRKHLRAQIPRKAIKLRNLFHRTQPRQLALGELARCGDALLAQRGEPDFAVEVAPRLAVNGSTALLNAALGILDAAAAACAAG